MMSKEDEPSPKLTIWSRPFRHRKKSLGSDCGLDTSAGEITAERPSASIATSDPRDLAARREFRHALPVRLEPFFGKPKNFARIVRRRSSYRCRHANVSNV